ncbi:MAG: hypothetical protein JSW61_04220 [Candidatus Thorarchaeota archaeon]|nr:MAG: hypothetical protein JSW61_04220 [Candidatus Thorarchaeota archaeon]
MLQTGFEALYGYISLAFILFGIFAIGWLIIHVEYSRHFSWFKVISAAVLGSLFLGFGIHFLILSFAL